MPNWLRRRLLFLMPEEQENRIREAIKENLDKNITREKKEESLIFSRFKHGFAKRWFRSVLRAIQRKSSEDSEWRDFIFIQFLENRLTFRISKKMHQVFTNSLQMTFVRILNGTFMMGSPETEQGRDNDESPQHKVTLTSDYYMQTTEVTQGQWKAVMGENPSYFKNCGDNCPVENVSWNDVQEFIRRLNKKSKQEYRLPTEAEWEYAARAGSTSAFANGDIKETGCELDPNLDKMGWYCGNSCVDYEGGYECSRCGNNCKKWGTQPVAQKKANKWNLYDMHGNVYEWCSDWYGDYTNAHVTNPVGSVKGSSRVLRGGRWIHFAWLCRSAIRNRFEPTYRFRIIGFRLVVSQASGEKAR
ncbi:MAG: Sulphatase-modifying factor [Candidatus Magnetoglobus multicellularis str. Araruama]|uniref:Sulphatase-modifying factor n=1 Tax=Candidatus Magnetoglobus multicellularis str. Araruama TaxID=890399 RepID=A0A1V1PDX9_9BACT|nr:MAG: Sulphatase-modifying factor [Candidatus Magnetoglobus multicellularis str. Araruama]